MYEFTPTGGGPVMARDSAIEIFRGHIAYHLTRESVQNIVDVVDTVDAVETYPVKAKFDLFSIKATQLPEYELFENRLKACRDFCRILCDVKAASFYDKAIELVVRRRDIKVLKISDYRTKGLTGGDESVGGHYFRLMKTTGAGQTARGAGGSYGFGKNAYFAASDFHTFFASSYLGNEGHVFQGRMTLSSHKIDGTVYQPFGYYGLEGMKPVRGPSLIPGFFSRDEADGKGTDIYIIGFNDDSGDKKWDRPIVEAILANFWPAILWNMLEVSIGDLTINAKNIKDIMEKYCSKWTGDEETGAENPLPFFLAYTGAKNIKRETFLGRTKTLEKVEFHVAIDTGFPKRVACVRKTGMVIQTPRFGHLEEYAGVFVCSNDVGNEILRQTENAEHSKWDYHKVDAADKRLFRTAIKEYGDFVRDSLRKIETSIGREMLPVMGLPDFLNVPELEGETAASGKLTAGPGNGASTAESGVEVGVTGKEEPVKPTGRIPVVGPPPPPPPPPGPGQLPIKFRSFVPQDKGVAVQHTVILKNGPKNGICDIKIRAGTEDSLDSLEIGRVVGENGTIYSVDKGMVKKIAFGKDGNATLFVWFEGNERYSLNIEAYESK